MKNTLLTITGPSLAGKSTLENRLAADFKVEKIVSFTTRPPRNGEVHGRDYYFLTKEEAQKRIFDGEMAEWIQLGLPSGFGVNDGDYYGILGAELEDQLKKNSCIAVVEPNGVRQLRQYAKDANIRHVALYLTNPPAVLAARFLNRFKEDAKADIFNYARRMLAMPAEQNWLHEFNYDGVIHKFDAGNLEQVVPQVYHDYIWQG